MVNIFIANLDWTITSEDLKTTFSSFGDVHYAHVVYEKETKRSKGFGYIEMESAECAIRAIEALNGVEINGRAIDVKIASPKTNRPAKKVKPEKKNYGVKEKFSRGRNFNPNQAPISTAKKSEYNPESRRNSESVEGIKEVEDSEPIVRRILRARKSKND